MTCQAGSIKGFPLRLQKTLYDYTWANEKQDDMIKKLKDITIPTDFTINWQPAKIFTMRIVNTAGSTGVFQITGFDAIASGTTITYGSAQYRCSNIMSIVQNQHPFACKDTMAQYEVILAFQIINKNQNPSSPDVILMCRPLCLTNKTNDSTPFWPTVDAVAATGNPQQVSMDLSTIYAFNSKTPMPMVTYQTCMPVTLVNPREEASLRVRVNVITQPIYVNSSNPNGLGKCRAITKYTLASPSSPVNLFGSSASRNFQFSNGLNLPTRTVDNFIMGPPASLISDFDVVIRSIELQVPEQMMGKSLSEIAATTQAPAPVNSAKKQFKCYTINPDTDIKGDQILIDPTTGQRLTDTVAELNEQKMGGDPSLLEPSSGLLPGDIENILTIIFVTIGSICLFGYWSTIMYWIFYTDIGIRNVLIHIVALALLIAGLVAFSVFEQNHLTS